MLHILKRTENYILIM